MPSPSDFRKAFELSVGASLGKQFRIERSTVGHDIKEQNERYEFPTTLEVAWAGGGGGRAPSEAQAKQRGKALADEFGRACKKERVVYSAYGSPYACTYALPASVKGLDSEGQRFELRALGRARRRRDIPTQAQRKAEERERAGAQEVSKEDEKRWLAGHRVIKSRFGTSKCSICGSTIDPGVKIAKEEGGSRGGWAHATCVLGQVKGSSSGGSGAEEAEEPSGAEEEEEEAAQSQESEEEHEEAAAAGSKRKRGGAAPAPLAPTTKAKKHDATAQAGGAALKAAGTRRCRHAAEE